MAPSRRRMDINRINIRECDGKVWHIGQVASRSVVCCCHTHWICPISMALHVIPVSQSPPETHSPKPSSFIHSRPESAAGEGPSTIPSVRMRIKRQPCWTAVTTEKWGYQKLNVLKNVVGYAWLGTTHDPGNVPQNSNQRHIGNWPQCSSFAQKTKYALLEALIDKQIIPPLPL